MLLRLSLAAALSSTLSLSCTEGNDNLVKSSAVDTDNAQAFVTREISANIRQEFDRVYNKYFTKLDTLKDRKGIQECQADSSLVKCSEYEEAKFVSYVSRNCVENMGTTQQILMVKRQTADLNLLFLFLSRGGADPEFRVFNQAQIIDHYSRTVQFRKLNGLEPSVWVDPAGDCIQCHTGGPKKIRPVPGSIQDPATYKGLVAINKEIMSFKRSAGGVKVYPNIRPDDGIPSKLPELCKACHNSFGVEEGFVNGIPSLDNHPVLLDIAQLAMPVSGLDGHMDELVKQIAMAEGEKNYKIELGGYPFAKDDLNVCLDPDKVANSLLEIAESAKSQGHIEESLFERFKGTLEGQLTNVKENFSNLLIFEFDQ